MKLILGIILINITVLVFGQNSLDCSEVKTGKFRLSDETSGTTIIKRTKKHQTETNDKLNFKAKYEIVWIDDCTYEVRDSKGGKGSDKLKGNSEHVLTVRILWIKDGMMKVRSASDLTDLEVEVEMEILK